MNKYLSFILFVFLAATSALGQGSNPPKQWNATAVHWYNYSDRNVVWDNEITPSGRTSFQIAHWTLQNDITITRLQTQVDIGSFERNQSDAVNQPCSSLPVLHIAANGTDILTLSTPSASSGYGAVLTWGSSTDSGSESIAVSSGADLTMYLTMGDAPSSGLNGCTPPRVLNVGVEYH